MRGRLSSKVHAKAECLVARRHHPARGVERRSDRIRRAMCGSVGETAKWLYINFNSQCALGDRRERIAAIPNGGSEPLSQSVSPGVAYLPRGKQCQHKGADHLDILRVNSIFFLSRRSAKTPPTREKEHDRQLSKKRSGRDKKDLW